MNFFGKSRLTPLAASAQGSVVGTHDGVRSTLHIGALDDDVVFHHEYGHEILFTRTLDGGLLALLWQAIDRPARLKNAQIGDLRTTADTLMRGCQFSHEVFATYYGVKMVEPAVGAAALVRLPDEYRRYFATAESAIDPFFKSTFLQVRVALTLSCLAFQSRFLQRFLVEPMRAWKSLEADETPNLRMEALLGDLGKGGGVLLRDAVRVWSAEYFAQSGAAAWNVEQEFPMGANPVAEGELDVFLDQRIETWLVARGIVPTLSKEERRACVEALRAFAPRIGVNLREVVSVPEQSVPGLSLEEQLRAQIRGNSAMRAQAMKQADSYIANTTIGLTFPHVVERDLWRSDLYRRSGELHVVAGDPLGDSEPWTLIRYGPKGSATNFKSNGLPAHGARIDKDEVVDWLNAMVDDRQSPWPAPLPKVIVLPFGAETLVGKRSFSFDGAAETGCIDSKHNERIAMYVMGNWVDFVETAANKFGPVVLTELHAEISGYGANPQPLSVKIALCPRLPGKCHLRIFARNASLMVDTLQLDWQANPRIRILPTQQAEAEGLDTPFVSNTVNAILAFWSRF